MATKKAATKTVKKSKGTKAAVKAAPKKKAKRVSK